MQKSRKWVHNLCRMYRNHWKPFVCVCVCGSLTAQKVGNAVCRWSGDRSETVSYNQCCAKTLDNEDWHQSAKFEGRTGKATPCPRVLSPRLQWKTKQDERKVFTASLFFWCFWEPFHKSSYRSLPVPVQQQQDTPRVSVEGGAKRQVEPGGAAVYAQRKQSIS